MSVKTGNYSHSTLRPISKHTLFCCGVTLPLKNESFLAKYLNLSFLTMRPSQRLTNLYYSALMMEGICAFVAALLTLPWKFHLCISLPRCTFRRLFFGVMARLSQISILPYSRFYTLEHRTPSDYCDDAQSSVKH